MKNLPVALLLILCGTAGCTSVPLPANAAAVSLVAVSSPSVEVHRPRFRYKEGDLKLEAYFFRQWKAETTADTHVDFVFLDVAGKTLGVETTNFSPRSLPHSGVRGRRSAYLLTPIQVPAGTRALEVRAHDGPHNVPPGRQP